MQIIIDQNEITEAIETFVRQQITIADDQEVSVDLKAGRGDNGFSATIEIRQAAKAKHKQQTTRRATPNPTQPVAKLESSAESNEPLQQADADNSEEQAEVPEPVKASVTLTPAVKTGTIFGNRPAVPAPAETDAATDVATEGVAAPASVEEPVSENVAAPAAPKKSIFNFGQAGQTVAAE